MANFKATAEGCGGTAVVWSQGNFLGKQTFGRAGVCGPLSAKWIKDRKLGISFKNDTATTDGRDEVMQLKINQHTTPGTYVENYLQLVGLSKHTAQAFNGDLSLSQLIAWATGGPGYYFIGISNRGVGGAVLEGHALAIDMYAHKVFDANNGQASFNTAQELKQFFAQWFRLSYMDLRGDAYIERYF